MKVTVTYPSLHLLLNTQSPIKRMSSPTTLSTESATRLASSKINQSHLSILSEALHITKHSLDKSQRMSSWRYMDARESSPPEWTHTLNSKLKPSLISFRKSTISLSSTKIKYMSTNGYLKLMRRMEAESARTTLFSKSFLLSKPWCRFAFISKPEIKWKWLTCLTLLMVPSYRTWLVSLKQMT